MFRHNLFARANRLGFELVISSCIPFFEPESGNVALSAQAPARCGPMHEGYYLASTGGSGTRRTNIVGVGRAPKKSKILLGVISVFSNLLPGTT